jgi:hypothetical protein
MEASKSPMTYRQLLQAMAVEPPGAPDGDIIFPLPDLTRAQIIARLGEPAQAEVKPNGRTILVYVVDGGGKVLIAGTERDGVITGGMLYIGL